MKRTDIHTILVPGSGAIVIGQAAEFDYSGTQAVKAFRAEGYRVVLVNSNPATIMTDPGIADATYIEPLTPEILGSNHCAGRTRCHASHGWRANGTQSRSCAQRKWRA